MSIATELTALNANAEKLESDLTEIKTSLTNKKVSVPEDTKISNVPALIDSITSGSTVKLIISAADYEGQTLTATKDSSKFTGTVKSGECTIEVDGEGTWKVSATDGNSVEIVTTTTYRATLSSAKLFGVKITHAESNPTNRVVYTDDAVGMLPVSVSSSTGAATYNNWDKTWIFDKIYPVMLSTDGQIAYKLNPNDYSKKADGTASDVATSGFAGNAMICVEKFYTKFSTDTTNEYIQISDKKFEGSEAIGFIRADGTEADRVFLPMYMGCNISNRLRSISGQNVLYSTSFNDFRTYAKNNGNGYEIETYAMNQMFAAVYMILMKSDNQWGVLGKGRNYSGAKTGILNNKGPIAYDPSSGCVKFMHMEDFISDKSSGMYRWEAGLLSQSSKIYVKMKPDYSGTSTSGYAQATPYVYQSGNYVSRSNSSNNFGRVPTAGNGSDSTYQCDYYYSDSSSTLRVALRGDFCGVFGRFVYSDASYTNVNIGAALSYLPPA